jgi:hypothetical protein
LALFFIGLIIRIGCKFSPLPGGLPGALALNAAAVALVFYARVWNKPTTAVGAPNLAHGFSPQETILDGLKAGYGYCGKIWKGKKTRQRNWEEKGLRMREVKKQRRNWAGMSTHNINKHETELAKTLNSQGHPIL